MSEKISVIIPVYKSEKYLAKCVDSVLAQTYENLEVILVEDGSPDGSGALCDEYARKDGRVKAIHKENGGASSARNAGLDIATGDYIGFIDSDDYIEPDMYEKLYQALKETGAGVSMCDFIYVEKDGTHTAMPPLERAVLTPPQAFEMVEFSEERWRFISLVNRLYKREIFDTVRLREGRMCEDEIAVIPIFERSGGVAVIPDVLYWDVWRPNSVMTSTVSVKNLAAVEAFTERYDFYRGKGWGKLAHSALRRAYTWLWYVMAHVDVREKRSDVRPWLSEVMKRQIKCLDPRAGLLWMRYIYGLLRGGAKTV